MDNRIVYIILSGVFLILAIIALIAGNPGQVDYKVSFYGCLAVSTIYSVGSTIISEIRKLKV